MSEECTHDCSTCGSDCDSRTETTAAPMHEDAFVRRVYAVCGAKGGVGRTTVAALLASCVQKKHVQAAVLDADITGSSVPAAFGLTGRVTPDSFGMFPMETQSGVQVIGVNLIIPDPTDPVIARGTLVDNTLKKFWSEVIWEDVDLLLVDMPAGTGEVPLSVMRNMSLDGVIVVTEAGKAAAMMTEKTLKMARALKIPVVALVVNRDGANADLDDRNAELAEKYRVRQTVRLPYDPRLAVFMDEGEIEMYNTDVLDPLIDRLF
ncbi:MAG: P-loop NTPase [Oscillospiraceae bacterium]|nr:P-loop NTPase [Oscillospiraceae bacterium]